MLFSQEILTKTHYNRISHGGFDESMGKKAVLTVLLALIVSSICMINFRSAGAQLGNVIIDPDGSVTGSNNIQRDGNVYTLTGNISGGILVQKSYVVIDGAGFTVDGGGGRGVDLGNGVGQDPTRRMISNVTVTNLKIINCAAAVSSENTHNNTFIGNSISGCDDGFWITGSANNTLIHNTIKDCTTGISINYGSNGNVIVENNILSGWSVWLSHDPVVDRNYWGDYTIRFPNAKEIGNSGVWDTPYSRGDKVIDYHPLTKPIAISEGNPEVSNEQNTMPPSSSELQPEPLPDALTGLIIVASIFGIVVAGAVLMVYHRRKQAKKRGMAQ
jgi:parallel beta-helix repeat protein